MSKYEAVIGDDIETTVWGASDESADNAIASAVVAYAGDLSPVVGKVYPVTVYANPTNLVHPGGEEEVVGWSDRGTAQVVYAIKDFQITASRLSLKWDGVAVTP